MKTAVCIASFRRPEELRALLAGLDGLHSVTDVEIIVVDNDAGETARAVCADWAKSSRWALHYAVEPRRGICKARNRALQEAKRIGAGLVAFIDDDEVPAPEWLAELQACMVRFKADSVIGPVVPRFESPPPEWIVEGGFFQRPRFMTGVEAKIGRTGNMLARSELFEAVGGFDERFDSTGGGDTHLSLKAGQKGFRAVFCDEAVVYETVPPERANAGWLLRRNYRIGNSWAAVRGLLHPGLAGRLLLFVKGLLLIAAGGILLPASVSGRRHAVRLLGMVCRGAGLIAGLLGHRYQEYARKPS